MGITIPCPAREQPTVAQRSAANACTAYLPELPIFIKPLQLSTTRIAGRACFQAAPHTATRAAQNDGLVLYI